MYFCFFDSKEPKIIGSQEMKLAGRKLVMHAGNITGLWPVFIVDGSSPLYRQFSVLQFLVSKTVTFGLGSGEQMATQVYLGVMNHHLTSNFGIERNRRNREAENARQFGVKIHILSGDMTIVITRTDTYAPYRVCDFLLVQSELLINNINGTFSQIQGGEQMRRNHCL